MPYVTWIGYRDLTDDVLGADLISNYHFTSGTTGWADTSAAGGTVSVTPQGRVSMVYATGRPSLTHEIATVAGTLYRVDVDTVTLGQSVSHWFGTSSGGTQLGVMTPTAIGTASGFFVATGTTSYLRINGPTSANTNIYDNVRVRPVVARGHATSINHIINGRFTAVGTWTLGTGFGINVGTGKLDCDGTQTVNTTATNPAYASAVRIGKVYDTSFAVSNYSVGTVRVNVNGSGLAEGTGRTANGTYTQQITFSPTSSGAYAWELLADSSFTGAVDDFEVYLAADNEWSLDFNIQERQPLRESNKSEKRTMDGGTDTLFNGSNSGHTITTQVMPPAMWPFFEEFIANADDGQTITFDPRGTESQPQDPAEYVLVTDSAQLIRVIGSGPTEQRQYSFRLRSVPS